ncbi:PREDICTED: protein IQ-DOMAIN 14-like [Camelina sativa]|uniref:Protein IQ-DOMAIN 14-like n=1 Tax=Camelina sativa TaxID=90675 RepID=A0ABM0VFN6_CAMSA|nr:PREDICTED: protein IQ-DOMAIN 14-like [Camelina sativa]
MAKKNGTSWFTAVKKILWSPSKDSDHKKTHKKDTDYKKNEKKGWIFRKTKLETSNSVVEDTIRTVLTVETVEEEKPAVNVSAVDEAVAEIVKLKAPPGFIRRHCAAIVIQTAFRGYLSRRALRALRGIVKLQALVRGNNVRNQAKLTLRCIKALVRVQDQVLNHHQQQRSRVLSSSPSRNYNIEARRNSMFAESNGFWDTKTYLQDIRSRRSLSRDMSRCTNNEFDSEETESILQKKLEIAIKREKAQALALSNQIRSRSYQNQSAGDDRELLERTQWLDRWMATKQWDDTITNSTNVRDQIKTLELNIHHHQRSYPATPPSCRASRSVMVRSASPRIPCSPSSVQPNYMSATESAKAKARTQSTPRRRPITAKKRLCYAEEESLRSPSFKSAYNGCLWGDHESDYSCCYGDGYAGKISPCSTTDLRWLK